MVKKILLVILAFVALGIYLFSLPQKNKDDEDILQQKDVAKPQWEPFGTCLDNKKAFIYTQIKTYPNKGYIVWIKYEWEDSTQIPNESKNIVIKRYSFDSEFSKIGDVAHYDYLENGEAINSTERTSPEWSYIIPDSEGDNIAHVVIKILEKRNSFNRAANRLYRRYKYQTFYDL